MTKRLLFLSAAVFAPAAVWSQTAVAQNGWEVVAQNGWHVFNQAASTKLEGQSGPVYGHPLSASEVRDTTQTLSDGSHITHNETERFYRDGQGRMRTETESLVLIYDPVGGFSYSLNPTRKTYTKNPIAVNATFTIAASASHSSTTSSFTATQSGQHSSTTSSNGAGQAVKTASSGTTESLPEQSFSGFMAKGSRVTVTIPSGSIGNDHELKVTNDRWYSDDLRLLFKTVNTDPRFGVTTYELQNIVQGEPAASLFQVPSDYTEGH